MRRRAGGAGEVANKLSSDNGSIPAIGERRRRRELALLVLATSRFKGMLVRRQSAGSHSHTLVGEQQGRPIPEWWIEKEENELSKDGTVEAGQTRYTSW